MKLCTAFAVICLSGCSSMSISSDRLDSFIGRPVSAVLMELGKAPEQTTDLPGGGKTYRLVYQMSAGRAAFAESLGGRDASRVSHVIDLWTDSAGIVRRWTKERRRY